MDFVGSGNYLETLAALRPMAIVVNFTLIDLRLASWMLTVYVHIQLKSWTLI